MEVTVPTLGGDELAARGLPRGRSTLNGLDRPSSQQGRHGKGTGAWPISSG